MKSLHTNGRRTTGDQKAHLNIRFRWAKKRHKLSRMSSQFVCFHCNILDCIILSSFFSLFHQMFVAVNITIHTSADYVHVISLFTHLKRCVATHFGKVLDANGNFRKETVV